MANGNIMKKEENDSKMNNISTCKSISIDKAFDGAGVNDYQVSNERQLMKAKKSKTSVAHLARHGDGQKRLAAAGTTLVELGRSFWWQAEKTGKASMAPCQRQAALIAGAQALS